MKKTKTSLSVAFTILLFTFFSCQKQNPETTTDAIDYTLVENWLDHATSAYHEIDVFYILPTCVSSAPDTTGFFDEDSKRNAHVAYTEGACAFKDYANLFVPYYRQVTMEILPQFVDTEDALALVRRQKGKTDIFAALDHYFVQHNNGRPFILASHSQGTIMMRIVLDEYMQSHPEYLERMIACYALGQALPESWFAKYPNLKKATGETDIGVIIGWNTEGPGATTSIALSGEDFVINPLTWSTGTGYANSNTKRNR